MLSTVPPNSIYSLLLTLHLLTPVNASLSLLLLGLLLSLIPSTSPSIPSYPLPATHTLGYYNYRPRHSKPAKWETFTPLELSQFTGNQQGGKVLIAIRRKVYDVTSGKSFYGPGGPYEIFAGRDASRGLAKQSFEEDMLVPVEGEIDGLEDLTKSEWENLTGWESHFQTKYFQCGDLVQSK
ncbi:hypothetical protein JCM5353_007515 [Sporobolomyces roseus]